MKMTPRVARLVMNLWPPFAGAGIRIQRIAPDWHEVDVGLRLGWLNRNARGVHFGGSLYAMTDPFYMLMLMQLLGPEYNVWDKAASIEFIRPGTGRLQARFRLSPVQVEAIRQATAHGERHLPEFTVDIVNEAGETVSRVRKTLYVRRHRPRG